jgi:hypothetical protein
LRRHSGALKLCYISRQWRDSKSCAVTLRQVPERIINLLTMFPGIKRNFAASARRMQRCSAVRNSPPCLAKVLSETQRQAARMGAADPRTAKFAHREAHRRTGSLPRASRPLDSATRPLCVSSHASGPTRCPPTQPEQETRPCRDPVQRKRCEQLQYRDSRVLVTSLYRAIIELRMGPRLAGRHSRHSRHPASRVRRPLGAPPPSHRVRHRDILIRLLCTAQEAVPSEAQA